MAKHPAGQYLQVLASMQTVVKPIPHTCCQPGANSEQERETYMEKGMKHEEPNAHEPRHLFKPRIGFGSGHLVSSPIAIC
jgi:hypothetical protein